VTSSSKGTANLSHRDLNSVEENAKSLPKLEQHQVQGTIPSGLHIKGIEAKGQTTEELQVALVSPVMLRKSFSMQPTEACQRDGTITRWNAHCFLEVVFHLN